MTSVAEPCARLVRVPMVVLFVLVVVESAIFFKPLSQFQVEEMNARLLIVQKHARALTRHVNSQQSPPRLPFPSHG